MYENKEKKEKKELEKKLKQLKHENKILQKKLNSLQFRINAENRKTAAAESRKKQDATQNINADRNGDEMIDDICESEMLFTSRSYPGYLIKLMKSSSLFSNYNKFIVYFRRAKLLGILFRIIVFILRAGALILAYGVAFLVSIPVIIMMFAAMPVFSFINAPRSNSKITKKLSDKNVYILFPGRNSGFEKSKFFWKTYVIFQREEHQPLLLFHRILSKDAANSEYPLFTAIMPCYPKNIPKAKAEIFCS